MRKPKVNKKSAYKKLFERCQWLWSECVKARAFYRSEISMNERNLVAHHLVGKPNYRLRFDLDNGYCCTSGEHSFGFHVEGRREGYRQKVMAQRGEDIFERLEQLKWGVCKTDLYGVEIYLEQKLKEFKNNISPSGVSNNALPALGKIRQSLHKEEGNPMGENKQELS